MSSRIQHFITLSSVLLLLTFLPSQVTALAESQGFAFSKKVDPAILNSINRDGSVEFIIFLADQADLSGADNLSGKDQKATYVFEHLSHTADKTQRWLIDFLESQHVVYRSFWVANMIWVRGPTDLLATLAVRSDVAYLHSNPKTELRLPVLEADSYLPGATDVIEWNIELVSAPDVWNEGYRGQDTVIGGQDTGYYWSHPALKQQYRGWDGQNVVHDYNWHDAVHSGGGICGTDSPIPCDDNGHGTHTMGIMVGEADDSLKIGMAPDARWIGCRNMDRGVGTPITYSECYQWFIAPTDLNGENPDPTLAPHVINNSWSCPVAEGCTEPEILRTVVENVRAAGIVTVHAAGNGGSSCGTIDEPAANYDASFTVGATTALDTIANFSSRGPAIVGNKANLKPDVVAPGVLINSSLPGGGYGLKSGTSMAAPHVAGLVSLMISADPTLAGDVDTLELFITQTTAPKSGFQECGAIPPQQIPNNEYGYGRIDALLTISLVTGPRYFFPIFMLVSGVETTMNFP